MTSNPPRVDPALVAALREDLRAARFTVEGVVELLGPMAAAALDREQALPAQRVTAGSPSPCATLVRLFTLGDPVDAAEAARALPTLGVDGAVALGLIAPEGDGVVAAVRPAPVRRRRPRLVGRLRPRRAGDPQARAPGPRARHRRCLDDPGLVDAAATGGSRPRPRHRVRGAGAAPRTARGRGRRHRPVGASTGVRPLQRRPRRGRLAGALRVDARPGGGGAVRPRREQPARSSSRPARGRCRCTSTATGAPPGMPWSATS